MDKQTFFNLLDKYQDGTATAAEKTLVEGYYHRLEAMGITQLTTAEEADIKETMYRQIVIGMKEPLVRRMPVWKKVAAAAAILVLFTSSYFLFFNKNKKSTEMAVSQPERFKNDVDPGKYKARLTLADGSTIILDSAALGVLAKQGGTVVLNKDGKLVYSNESGVGSKEMIFNTLTTARGETYATILADGSKVWLNSGSSIKFPVAFTGAQRRVEITGEAYFEVQHNDKMPFIVSVNGMEVHDLGTAFNVNAYTEEGEIRTTLVEGSARVVSGNGNQLLSPGQQVRLNGTGQLNLIQHADIDEAVAWRNGRFLFKSTDIKTLMRQLNRWYDVSVSYESLPTTGFNAKISRETPLSSILKALELTGAVRFRIEGKKVVVMK